MTTQLKYPFLILILLVFACSEKPSKLAFDPEPNAHEAHASEESLIEHVSTQPCYFSNDHVKRKCDSSLIEIFGQKSFMRNVKWNEEKSFINCDKNEIVELVEFNDTTCCHPRSFDLVYDIKMDNISIYQFRMSAQSDEQFKTVSPVVSGQLSGYKILLNKGFKIDYKEAVKIAKNNGFSGENMTVEMYYDDKGDLNSKSSFHWRVDAHRSEDSRELLIINPNNGEIVRDSLILTTIACY